jgi:hypothetical protein
MSYIVKYKDRVVLGIIPWNNQYIMDVLRTRYRVNIEIPFIEPAESSFPLVVNDDVIIYPAEEDRQSSINPLIEFYYGPTWEFLDNKVIAHYEVRPLDLDSVKSNYKAKAAMLRYKKEVEGTLIILNETEFKLETNRDSRIKFSEKLVSMSNNVNWKFEEGWVSLTKENMQSIIDTIETHVQAAFDEEYNLHVLIEQAQNVDELLAIESLNKPEFEQFEEFEIPPGIEPDVVSN